MIAHGRWVQGNDRCGLRPRTFIIPASCLGFACFSMGVGKPYFWQACLRANSAEKPRADRFRPLTENLGASSRAFEADGALPR